MGERICTVEGCGKPANKRCWCYMHYRRWHLYGDPGPAEPFTHPAEGPCAVDGCVKPAQTRGWCQTHYDHWFRHGDPLPRRVRYAGTTCSIQGCGKQPEARGWCRSHYYSWKKHGDPYYISRPLAERFWERVAENGTCLEWTGPRNLLGYGLVNVNGRKVMAHRIAWKLLVGDCPEGLVPDHLCRNPPCVNLEHIEWVTNRENVCRGIGPTAKNRRKTHCVNGHPFDAVNTYWTTEGNRQCRECIRVHQRAYRRRKQFAPA